MNVEQPLAPADPKPGKRRRLWIVLVVSAGILGVLLWAFLPRSGSAQAARARGAAPREIPVVGVAARTGDLGVYVSGLGTVMPVNTVTVRSRVDGELVEVAYREGQLVHEGDLLARIDPRPFEVQLHQAEGQLAKDEAALKNAQLDLARYRTLVEQDSVPKQQLDTQVATVDQGEATVKTDRAQIESAKLNLTYSRITAPISGRTGLRLVDPGNIVHANDAGGLVVLTQVQPITVVFTIPADRLPAILKEVRAGRTLAVEAWDRDLTSRLSTGTLLAVDNQIDPTTGTIRIKGLFRNDDFALFPNQFVNARLLVDTLKGATIVPTAALQRSPQKTFVYVVQKDGSVAIRDVDVRVTEGDETAVAGPVGPGDVVVVDGVEKLQPGSKVTVSTPGGGRKPAG